MLIKKTLKKKKKTNLKKDTDFNMTGKQSRRYCIIYRKIRLLWLLAALCTKVLNAGSYDDYLILPNNLHFFIPSIEKKVICNMD